MKLEQITVKFGTVSVQIKRTGTKGIVYEAETSDDHDIATTDIDELCKFVVDAAHRGGKGFNYLTEWQPLLNVLKCTDEI